MATNNGMKLDTIAKEQFVRPGRCVIDHQQSIRQCFALTSCDLVGCYDRIVHTVAALALLMIGVPHNRIKSMFGAIQKMVHRIKIIYGESDISYGGDDLGDWENYPQEVKVMPVDRIFSWY